MVMYNNRYRFIFIVLFIYCKSNTNTAPLIHILFLNIIIIKLLEYLSKRCYKLKKYMLIF